LREGLERARAWRVAGLLACALVAAVIIAGRGSPGTLALIAAGAQATGAAAIAVIWPHRREARLLLFCLLCFAVWAGGTGIVASLAISTALALFLGFLHLAVPPVTIARRVVTFGAFGFDTVAAAFSLWPPPDAWSLSVLLALEISVVMCCWLAARSSRERRRLIVPVVVPIIAFSAVMALEHALALAGSISTASGAFGIAQALTAIAIPFGFVMGAARAA
jgi:hypothetical protein